MSDLNVHSFVDTFLQEEVLGCYQPTKRQDDLARAKNREEVMYENMLKTKERTKRCWRSFANSRQARKQLKLRFKDWINALKRNTKLH